MNIRIPTLTGFLKESNDNFALRALQELNESFLDEHYSVAATGELTHWDAKKLKEVGGIDGSYISLYVDGKVRKVVLKQLMQKITKDTRIKTEDGKSFAFSEFETCLNNMTKAGFQSRVIDEYVREGMDLIEHIEQGELDEAGAGKAWFKLQSILDKNDFFIK